MMVVKSGGAGTRRRQVGADGRAATSEALTSDYIDYMADIIQELQRMAEQGGLVTLGGILGLAHTEARLCQERDRKSHSA
jgi:hypothetical protein